ncbi:MAG: PilN domain-containing protein [Candidatus Saccharimonadota bacterium]
MIEINLIPDVKQELLRAQRTRATVISVSIFTSIIAAGLVVALVFYVFAVQTVRSSFLDGRIDEEASALAENEDLPKLLTIQNQLSTVNALNAQKKIDSRIFDVLAAVIPPEPNNVVMSQVSINATDSTIRIEGQTRGYDSMEVFKKTLDNAVVTFTQPDSTEVQTVKLASDISVTDTSYGANADNVKVLRFVLTFKYPEELFSPDIAGVTIKLNINGNVTDSYLGLPKSIFEERASDL